MCRVGLATAMSIAVLGFAVSASAQSWPDVFNPLQVTELEMTLDSGDWATIRNDTTFDIEVPAYFGAVGEEPILVSVRRKSGDPINGKISLKVDINEYVSGQKWRGLKKLSLENGDDQDVVAEGLAWYLHTRAGDGLLNGYNPGMAAWVNLAVNGVNEGVYLSVEQVDKQFLKNRDLWDGSDTWLYKQGDISAPDLKESPDDEDVSPALEVLNYSPFAAGGGKGKKGGLPPTPDDETLAVQLPELIQMATMLSVGACNAFVDNPDALFNHGKNFYFVDYRLDRRLYLPWDLDAAVRNTSGNIYAVREGRRGKLEQHPYQEVILNHPLFRAQFNGIMQTLLDGPFQPAEVIEFLDALEPILTPYLQADANSKMSDDVAGRFAELRQWIQARHANVQQQVLDDLGQ